MNLYSTTDLTESIPWRDAFPEFKDNVYETFLSGYQHRDGMTQEALSWMTGISRRRISEMENGKRPIEKETAFPSSWQEEFNDPQAIAHRHSELPRNPGR